MFTTSPISVMERSIASIWGSVKTALIRSSCCGCEASTRISPATSAGWVADTRSATSPPYE